jgi:hypothetical protein
MPITTPNYYAVPFPTFQRAMRNILSIDQGEVTTITTTYDGVNPGNHDYANGLIVRVLIPSGFGMEQIDKKIGIVTVINDTQFFVDINSTNFDPFVVPSYNPGHFGTPAVVVPVGEVNDILTMATQNVLPYP